jgi:hypothetical protein
MTKEYVLPMELGQKIMNYLVRHPWAEVNELIQELKSLREVKLEQKQEPKDVSKKS